METKTILNQDIVIPRPEGKEVSGTVLDVTTSQNLSGVYISLTDLNDIHDGVRSYLVSFGLYAKLLTTHGKDKESI